MTHNGLAADLAGHLRTERRMTWCDVQLGPSGSVRPDVYAIYKSYSNPCPMAYECKVSRSDFLSDVTAGKWQAYLRYACGVVFACESGLLKKSDIPAHCGLIARFPESGAWRMQKRPVLNPVTIPEEALLKLIIDGVEREGPRYRARGYSESSLLDKMRVQFGELTAKAIRDRLAVEHETESARRTAGRIEEDARERAAKIRAEAADHIAPLRTELCGALGLPADATHWTLTAEVRRIKKELTEHPAHESLRVLTNVLQRALDQHGYKNTGERAA